MMGGVELSHAYRGMEETEPADCHDAAEQEPGTGHMGALPARQWYTVAIFCLTGCLLFADQNLMAPNLTAIAEDLGLSREERDRYLGGYIAAAFYAVGAPAALVFGYLSDHVNRRNLLFVAVLLGEGPCVLAYFVTRFWQLFVLRVLTGISLGGAFPLIFSLMGDLFEPTRRAGVSAAVQLSVGAGLALGQGIAGFCGPSIGWRWPFVIVALPSIGVALLMVVTTQEPARGMTEASVAAAWQADPSYTYSERMTWRKLWRLFTIRTNVLVIGQGLFGCLPWGMLLTFLNDFLSQDKGLKVQTATAVVLAIGIGGAIGVIGGGIVGQWLYNRSKWTMSVFIGVLTMLGAPPMWFVINADNRALLGLTFVAALLTGVGSSVVGPNMRAMLLNVNEPEARGIALALQTMLDDLGKGLGPALVALLISSVGRTAAFNWATAAWVPCGALLLGTALTLADDERAMQLRLASSLRAARGMGGEGEAAALMLGTGKHAVPHPAVAVPLEPIALEEEPLLMGDASGTSREHAPHPSDASVAQMESMANGVVDRSPPDASSSSDGRTPGDTGDATSDDVRDDRRGVGAEA